MRQTGRFERSGRHLLRALCCWLSLVTPAVAEESLVILTWSDYIDPQLVAAFEATHHAKVSLVYYESDDVRTEMLLETDGQTYDLVLVSGVDLSLYRRRGWLAPLDAQRLPSLRHIDPRWRDAYADARDYGVPYFWGTLGIAYRRDLIDEPMTHWAQLLQPAPGLARRIVMIDASRDLIGVALKALGHSLNSEDPVALEAAEQLLLAQQPAVKVYAYPALNKDSDLVSGSIVAAMMFNGDAQVLKDYNDRIDYVVPTEGSNLWVDYFVMTRGTTRRALAEAFLEFINEPRHAAQNALHVNYATTNRAAEQYLPPDYFANPVIYPPKHILARCEPYTGLSVRALKSRNTIMNRVRAGH